MDFCNLQRILNILLIYKSVNYLYEVYSIFLMFFTNAKQLGIMIIPLLRLY